MVESTRGPPAKTTTCFKKDIKRVTHLRKEKSGLHCCRDCGEYEDGSQLIVRSLVLDDLIPFLLKLLADLFKVTLGAATAIADVGYDTVGSFLLGAEEVNGRSE